MSPPAVAPAVVSPAGHPTSVWAPRVAAAPELDLAGLRRAIGAERDGTALLVVSAHPDDETVGAGRLIHLWSGLVGPCAALLATAGEACLDHVGPRPAGLAERRLAEWRSALGVLGATEAGVAHLPDGRLTAYESFLVERVRCAADRWRTEDGLVIAAPDASDPHPDHQAAGRAAATVAAALGVPLLGFPVWLTYWAHPDDHPGPLWRLTTDAAAEQAYAEALACFDSQLSPLRPHLTPVVPREMLEHHRTQLLLPGAR